VAAGDPALARLAAEPSLALTPGPTGLEAFAAIIGAAGAHLCADGSLILEHGSTQAGAVAGLLERHGFEAVSTHADAAGLPRATQGRLRAASDGSPRTRRCQTDPGPVHAAGPRSGTARTAAAGGRGSHPFFINDGKQS
jgi:hypothetical protein